MLTDIVARTALPQSIPTRSRSAVNIATTPGKVIHETAALPADPLHARRPKEGASSVPLLIFPPWINRFYILDLNPAKSFVAGRSNRACRSSSSRGNRPTASPSVTMDDYVLAGSVDAIDTVRAAARRAERSTRSAIASRAPRSR
jgi:polyhydroxyalkanoate synthase